MNNVVLSHQCKFASVTVTDEEAGKQLNCDECFISEIRTYLRVQHGTRWCWVRS